MITLKLARQAGKVSLGNTKMPGTTFALSPSFCTTGQKLAKVQGSVCSRCYAAKLEKLRPSVRQGWTKNTQLANEMIARDPSLWVKYIVAQLRRAGQPYHRWFDSGDLQSFEMLEAIVEIARQTPEIRHWLPTKEARFVNRWVGDFPENLVVRVSAPKIGQRPVKFENTSTVDKHGEPFTGHKCPAYSAENRAMDPERKPNCGSCRACWDRTIANISYDLH